MLFSVSSGMDGPVGPGHRLRRKSGSSSGPRGGGGRLRAAARRAGPGPAGEEPGDRPDDGEEQDQQQPQHLGQVALPRLLGLDAVDQRRRSSARAGARVGQHSQHPVLLQSRGVRRSYVAPPGEDAPDLAAGPACRARAPGSRPRRRAGGAAPGPAGRRAGPPAPRPASRCLPGRGARTTTAPTASPHSGSGVPTTTASLTPGHVAEQRVLDLAGRHLDPAGVDDVVDPPGPRRAGRPASRCPGRRCGTTAALARRG